MLPLEETIKSITSRKIKHSLLSIPVGGNTLSTKIKMAFSALSLIRLRITYTNWPTVRSIGTRYLIK